MAREQIPVANRASSIEYAIRDVVVPATKLESEGHEILKLNIGDPIAYPGLPTPKHMVDAYVDALQNGNNGYSPSYGLPQLRAAIAQDERRKGWPARQDDIYVCHGVTEALQVIFAATLEEGDIVLAPGPHYPPYMAYPQMYGAQTVEYKLKPNDGWRLDFDDIEAKMNESVKLLVLINPNNPTGSFVEKRDIDFLADGLKKYPHVTILSDEIYSRQIFDGKEMPTFFNYPELRERLIVLEGWSKAYSMTGWRLGWSFWPEHLVEHVNKLLINSVSCVNAAAQFAGIAALDGPDDSIDAMMEKFTQRRDLIYKGLNDLPGVECSLPGGAFYAFPKVIGTGMNGAEFARKAMHEAGVAIVPGSAFGETCQNYVRFSFAASRDNISQALENIKKMLK